MKALDPRDARSDRRLRGRNVRRGWDKSSGEQFTRKTPGNAQALQENQAFSDHELRYRRRQRFLRQHLEREESVGRRLRILR